MTHAHANKKGARYFYYVSTAHSRGKPAGSLARVSAPKLEQAVLEAVTPHLASTSTGMTMQVVVANSSAC